MAATIKILVVDDHALVRAGLKAILEAQPDIRVIGEATDGLEGIQKAADLLPDVILMDINMPRCSGLEALLKIKQSNPAACIIIVTVSDQESDLFEALRLGAQGYLLKGSSINEVVDSVRRCAAGEVTLSPQVIARLVTEFRAKEGPAGFGTDLSARELEVLPLVGEGLTNTEIARRLFISESTVRTYIRRILDKLQLKNRAAAVAYVARHPLKTNPPQ
jgi:DNA-binding NarL/FixJ family response regulator